MSLIGSLLTMPVVSFFFLQTHVSAPSSGSYVAFGSRIYNFEACLFYYINTYFYSKH